MRAVRTSITGSLIIAAAVVLTGCFPPPPGAAPLRYRDELPGRTVSVTRDVAYSTAQDGTANTLLLDLYRPTPDDATRRPLIVMVHGGGFRNGSRRNAAMVELARAYALRGFVAASIDYRLLGQPGGSCSDPDGDLEACRRAGLAAQHDAQAAIRYLRANAATYGIDPTRVAIQGGSAGGATAVLVAVNEEDVGDSGTPGQDSTVGAAMPISAGLPPGARALLAPVLDRTDAPVFLFYGTADPSQPVDWPQDTAALLNEQGGGAFLQPLEGGHVPGSPQARRTEIEQSSYFMYYMLDLAHAAGQPATAARALDALRAAHPAIARRLAAMQSR